MTPGEVWWRARCATRAAVDRFLLGRRISRAARLVEASGIALADPGFAVSTLPVGGWARECADARELEWAKRLRARADRIAAGRINLFDLNDCRLGTPVDWNRDPKSGRAAPLKFAPLIDYRDFQVTGDCKFVWELNRHHQLVVLGRAYRATGCESYARAAVELWRQWLAQCPYGMGINWRSPLELSIRLINWVWAIDLIRPSGVLTSPLVERLLAAAYLHLWDVSRNYSRGSSAANHLVGEAAGVFIASCYFSGFGEAGRWRDQSSRVLQTQIIEQTFPDGGSREQATGYHAFVLQFLLLAGLVARRTGCDFEDAYWERLHRMFRFIAALGEGGDTLPMIGDGDDGYVLDLGSNPHDVRPWLAVGAATFGDADLKAAAGDDSGIGAWLPVRNVGQSLEAVPVPATGRQLGSRAFDHSGYFLLQSGHHGSSDRISVTFDCGPLGFRSIAAHGHADALSFSLRAFGVDVLVDPGTYDYFTYPRWRAYFRSTFAHNTIVVDGANQSVMLGSFLWGKRARARCVEWATTDDGGRVCGEHDGYGRLASPVIHRRRLELSGRTRELVVMDELIARGRHDYAILFHFAEHCDVAWVGDNRCEVDAGAGRVTLVLDPRLKAEMLCGSEAPIAGWISRGYHRKAASTTLVGRCSAAGTVRLRCLVRVGSVEKRHGDSGSNRGQRQEEAIRC